MSVLMRNVLRGYFTRKRRRTNGKVAIGGLASLVVAVAEVKSGCDGERG